jgi:sigma-B regulation protein RsbU (phosphoserine phosphatase)
MEELKEGGLILGVMEDASYRTGEVNLEEEDMVLMFTDGVTEVHSAKKEMYSEERLLNFVLKLKELPAKEIIKKLHLEIIRFADQGQMEDDVTMVCIKRISN